jgi:RNA polymerase sigma factor (sigma-70 family)
VQSDTKLIPVLCQKRATSFRAQAFPRYEARKSQQVKTSPEVIISLKHRDSKPGRFDTLVRPHFNALYAAARRLTKSTHDAEDLVQEVCLKAFAHLDELMHFEFPRAWLLKVLYYEFIDKQRRDGRSPVALASPGLERDEAEFGESPADQPEEIVDRDQRVNRVLWAMRILGPDQSALVLMHDVEGFSIDELCALTGTAAGTVKAQLHRTRIKLGRLLAGRAAAPHLKAVGVRS